MSSASYASYLSGHSDNPMHINHVYEFRELATMIAKEQIELYLPRIESMVNRAVNRQMSSALSGSMKAIDIDVKRIIDITCKDLNAQFHSEEISKFFAEALKVKLEDALKNIDLKLIV